MKEQGRRWLLAGLILLAFALRVSGLEYQSLWRDEVDAIRFATGPLAEVLRLFVEPGQNGPLYYLLLRPWLLLAGQSEFGLRFSSVIPGVLAVVLVYRLSRRLLPYAQSSRSEAVSLLAALLAATSPYLVWYSQEGKMYALVVVLTLVSMDRFLAAVHRGGCRRWTAYVVATTAAFYVHLLAILLVPVQLITLLLAGHRTLRERWRAWLVSLAVLLVPYLPLAAWQLPLLVTPAETGFRFVSLDSMLGSLAASYSLGVVQGAAWWSMAPFAALVAVAILPGEKGRRWQACSGMLLGWLLIPIAGLFAISLSRPLYTARYLIYILPAFLLLLAEGVSKAGRMSRLLAAVLLASLLAANSWGLWMQARMPLKADFRSATGYLAERLAAQDVILFQIPYGRYAFDYYYERPVAELPAKREYSLFLPWIPGGRGEAYRWIEGPYTNAGMTVNAVDRLMRDLLADTQVVWMVATEVPMWDERELAQGWLAEHARLTDRAEFVRVEVFRYELER
jgi:4-amino-4-deoxy-L-arabinose transferase-like glycosyltransferase